MSDDANNKTKAWTLDDGRMLTLRHITPEDVGIEQAFVRKLSARSRFMRFHGTIKELNKMDLAKFTNPDPLKEEALIILHKGEKDECEEQVGVARFVIDTNNQGCEFAIVVADEWQGLGLGRKLMQVLISHANSREIKKMHGSVLHNNVEMLQFVKGLGFESTADPDDHSAIQVNKDLGDQSKL